MSKHVLFNFIIVNFVFAVVSPDLPLVSAKSPKERGAKCSFCAAHEKWPKDFVRMLAFEVGLVALGQAARRSAARI